MLLYAQLKIDKLFIPLPRPIIRIVLTILHLYHIYVTYY